MIHRGIVVASALVLGCSTQVGTESDPGATPLGKGDCASCAADETQFVCHTVRPEADGTAEIRFALSSLHDKRAVDLVWPESEEAYPFEVQPESSRASTLMGGSADASVRHARGRLTIETDNIGIDFGTLVLYENSDYERGYFRFENTLGNPGFYSEVWCELSHAPTQLNASELEAAFGPASEGAILISEGDSEPTFIQADLAGDDVTVAHVQAAFAELIDQELGEWHEGPLAIEMDSVGDTADRLAEWATVYEDDDEYYQESAMGWARIKTLFDANVTELRFFMVGPADENGELDDDRGTYLELFVGRSADGKLVGFYCIAAYT